MICRVLVSSSAFRRISPGFTLLSAARNVSREISCILALPSADMGTGSPRILWFFLHDSRRIWTGIHALHLQFRPRVRFLQPHRSHYNYRVRVRSHEPLPESHGSAHHSLWMVWNHEVRCRHIPDDGSQISTLILSSPRISCAFFTIRSTVS